jgi:hypothetical protein
MEMVDWQLTAADGLRSPGQLLAEFFVQERAQNNERFWEKMRSFRSCRILGGSRRTGNLPGAPL